MQISSVSNPMTYPLTANNAGGGGVQSKWSQAQAANADDADDADGPEEASPAHVSGSSSQSGAGGPSAIVQLSDAATAGNDSDSDTDSSDDTAQLTHDGSATLTGTESGVPTSDATGSTAGTDASPVKSLTYGALGLESPAEQATDNDSFYTAGRWLAAAVTIGGLISLFA